MGIEQESLDYIPTNKDIEEYTKQINDEINRLVNEMYAKTFIPKFEPYEINYSVKGLNFRKENPMIYTMSGINVIDPTKVFILNLDNSSNISDLKEEMINNKLIKGSLKERMIIKIKKIWYTIKFILFYLRIKYLNK